MGTIKKLLFRMKKVPIALGTSLNISTNEVIFIGGSHCNGILTSPPIDNIAYHNGVNANPDYGDSIYTDIGMTIPHPDGFYLIDIGWIYILNGKNSDPGSCE